MTETGEVKEFKFNRILPPQELREAAYGIYDFAERVKCQGNFFIVLPFRLMEMEHYIRPKDHIPSTVFSWRSNGYDYIAFPHLGQRVVSIHRSNSGIVKVRILEPAGWIINLETSLEAAANAVKYMRQITLNKVEKADKTLSEVKAIEGRLE